MSISEIDNAMSIQEVVGIINDACESDKPSLAAHWVVESVLEEKGDDSSCLEDYVAHAEVLRSNGAEFDIDSVVNCCLLYTYCC